jgi:hypothetical protein
MQLKNPCSFVIVCTYIECMACSFIKRNSSNDLYPSFFELRQCVNTKANNLISRFEWKMSSHSPESLGPRCLSQKTRLLKCLNKNSIDWINMNLQYLRYDWRIAVFEIWLKIEFKTSKFIDVGHNALASLQMYLQCFKANVCGGYFKVFIKSNKNSMYLYIIVYKRAISQYYTFYTFKYCCSLFIVH